MCLAACAGPADGATQSQWERLQPQAPLLAAVPEDEVLAELLATQVRREREGKGRGRRRCSQGRCHGKHAERGKGRGGKGAC